jgi:hypothetical protein
MLRRYGLAGWEAEPLGKRISLRLGRRPSAIRRHSVAANDKKSGIQPIRILREGEILAFLANDIHTRVGSDVPVRAAVKVRILEARPLLSPAYYLKKGITEAEVRAVWMARYGYRLAAKT